ncbi:ATP-binding protein [Pseudoxanthomonas mexicana]|uniref:ATP-binding protein n=1 Tax=Pseudoxanthomonas mexicana TaxID=128785 RepID=UPI0024E1EC06|nr:ATP-binding protein [Pseudoxanthomonas mexicana]
MQMRLFIPREHARVDDLNASLEAVLANNGVSPAIQGDVRLIVEELASNAIEHGDLARVEAEEHELCVDIAIREHLLTLEFRESGAPFNPLEQPPPDLDADILDRPTGGLGLHLVRQVSEQASYQRIGNYNVVRLTLRIPTEETGA